MNVKQAIEAMQQLPQGAQLMVPSLGDGGSVPLQGFELVDEEWVGVIYCNNHEREQYGLSPAARCDWCKTTFGTEQELAQHIVEAHS